MGGWRGSTGGLSRVRALPVTAYLQHARAWLPHLGAQKAADERLGHLARPDEADALRDVFEGRRRRRRRRCCCVTAAAGHDTGPLLPLVRGRTAARSACPRDPPRGLRQRRQRKAGCAYADPAVPHCCSAHVLHCRHVAGECHDGTCAGGDTQGRRRQERRRQLVSYSLLGRELRFECRLQRLTSTLSRAAGRAYSGPTQSHPRQTAQVALFGVAEPAILSTVRANAVGMQGKSPGKDTPAMLPAPAPPPRQGMPCSRVAVHAGLSICDGSAHRDTHQALIGSNDGARWARPAGRTGYRGAACTGGSVACTCTCAGVHHAL